MESRFPNPCDDHDGIGNQSGRIPDSLSEHHGNEDVISFTGNLDIRVPERLKRDDGPCAGGTLEEEDAGEDASGEKRRNQEPERRPTTEEPKNSSVKDATTREEVPEGRELRHVPRGTWLNQFTQEATFLAWEQSLISALNGNSENKVSVKDVAGRGGASGR
ncbi:hypothetical protein NDU88_000129 [Pleurodeles waltl]|uniref:Uncharacterized protein n=1 Tax=Pleurodeles waltl TaxID=8319 RepID=A0AAV7KMA5_PLEWA|nr:hypothetical protein NDU88_000129 [Pleurodeles waltl]